MPTELDELLEKVDVEASKGAKTRPTALVLALTEIIPFHPQTIKVRLRLLQRRRENTEIESRYARERSRFMDFVALREAYEADGELGEGDDRGAALDDGDADADGRDGTSAGDSRGEGESVGKEAE